MAKNVVLGRGVGECILIELNESEWMVIDCFNVPGSKKVPAPIDYLNSIGLEPSQVIKKILITHFHDDHVQGMSALIKLVKDAEIYVPAAFTISEAAEYYAKQNVSNAFQDLSGIKEFTQILDTLEQDGRTITGVKHSMVIYRDESLELYALSPSEKDCTNASKDFIALASGISEASKMSKCYPNNYCVVLSARCLETQRSALFGSDLEISTDSDCGWEAAISGTLAPRTNEVDIFKIPHHGSENGYHQYTVENVLTKNVISVVTTFDRCNLPRAEFIDTYKSCCDKVIATTRPKEYKLKDVANPFVQKMIKQSSIEIKNVQAPNYGYVELERRGNSVDFNLFKDATVL